MHHLAETPEFTKQIAGLSGIPRGNEALNGLLWAIRRGPNDFPVLDATTSLRLAKSERLLKKPGAYVRLYVWFAFSDPKIQLLELEVVPQPVSTLMM